MAAVVVPIVSMLCRWVLTYSHYYCHYYSYYLLRTTCCNYFCYCYSNDYSYYYYY